MGITGRVTKTQTKFTQTSRLDALSIQRPRDKPVLWKSFVILLYFLFHLELKIVGPKHTVSPRNEREHFRDPRCLGRTPSLPRRGSNPVPLRPAMPPGLLSRPLLKGERAATADVQTSALRSGPPWRDTGQPQGPSTKLQF